jgi:hypothetical protein
MAKPVKVKFEITERNWTLTVEGDADTSVVGVGLGGDLLDIVVNGGDVVEDLLDSALLNGDSSDCSSSGLVWICLEKLKVEMCLRLKSWLMMRKKVRTLCYLYSFLRTIPILRRRHRDANDDGVSPKDPQGLKASAFVCLWRL